MADPLLLPFAAIRPELGRAQDVIARPYDVVTVEEARQGAAGRPHSFLHVSRAEIDLPAGTDPYGDAVYAGAGRALAGMLADCVLIREGRPCFYIYRMQADGHTQTGIAAAAPIAAYESNRVRRHEHTRPAKEIDRARQILAVGAHTGPVLAAFAPDQQVSEILAAATAAAPIADATTDEGTRHQVWRLDDLDTERRLRDHFAAEDAIYIADGHHRSAAAARVYRQHGAGDGHFLVIAFPENELRILGYNRIVRDLNGMDREAFLAACGQAFAIAPADAAVLPGERSTFGMFLDGRWFNLSLRQPPGAAASPVDRLDVSLLSRHLLEPVLGIGDPRTDPRIDFVGGGRGLNDLERRVRSGEAAVAFSLFPTAFADVIAVADAGEVMPPKSTWFEPKLADGLLSLPLHAQS